jgi:hypothetical protein
LRSAAGTSGCQAFLAWEHNVRWASWEVREFHPSEEYNDLAAVTDDEDDKDEVVTVEAMVKQEVPVLEGLIRLQRIYNF